MFGLEVNWSLLKQKEEETREERQLHKEKMKQELTELNERRRAEKLKLFNKNHEPSGTEKTSKDDDSSSNSNDDNSDEEENEIDVHINETDEAVIASAIDYNNNNHEEEECMVEVITEKIEKITKKGKKMKDKKVKSTQQKKDKKHNKSSTKMSSAILSDNDEEDEIVTMSNKNKSLRGETEKKNRKTIMDILDTDSDSEVEYIECPGITITTTDNEHILHDDADRNDTHFIDLHVTEDEDDEVLILSQRPPLVSRKHSIAATSTSPSTTSSNTSTTNKKRRLIIDDDDDDEYKESNNENIPMNSVFKDDSNTNNKQLKFLDTSVVCDEDIWGFERSLEAKEGAGTTTLIIAKQNIIRVAKRPIQLTSRLNE